jgi:hypothetical protein
MAEVSPGVDQARLLTVSKRGFISASIFLVAGALELAFFVGAVSLAAALPSGSTDTLPLSPAIGIALLLGQTIHIVGLLCAFAGILWDEKRTLASIAAVSNSIIPLTCLFSSLA